MMKRIFLFLFLFAAVNILSQNSFAQTTPKAKAKTTKAPATTPAKTTAKTTSQVKPVATAAEFNINGTVTGFTEGTTVELLNGQTGATELSTLLKNGQFSFKGKMEQATALHHHIFRQQQCNHHR
jgi:CRISPR/Cas system-associated exonuclease Cas4 (RecB family)